MLFLPTSETRFMKRNLRILITTLLVVSASCLSAQISWTGTISSDWNNSGNWNTNVIPTVLDDVVIPNVTIQPIINQSPDNPAVCHDLTINSGSQLIINPGKAFTVYGNINNLTGNSGLIIKSDISGTGSLIHHSAEVPGTIERYVPGNDWRQISSPISNAISGIYQGEYLQQWQSCNWVDITTTELPLSPMVGFAIYNPANFTAQYKGLLNQGTIGSVDNLPSESSCCGFQVVGNPYSSSIDWNASSGWTRVNLDRAYYIHKDAANWTAFVNGVGVNGGSRYIATGQGFFVMSNDITKSSTMVMNDSVRVHCNTPFFKDAINYLVRLNVSGGNNYQDETVIRFVSESTTGFDVDWDAFKILGDVDAAPQIYSIIPDLGNCTNMLAINTLPTTQIVPLGFLTAAQGTYTISATEINGLGGVKLEDRTSRTITNLAENSYTFNFDGGEDDSRFFLHFYPLSLVNSQEFEFAKIYSCDHSVYVNILDNEKGTLLIYNPTGQLISSSELGTGLNRINLYVATGNYIAKLVTSCHSMVKKLAID